MLRIHRLSILDGLDILPRVTQFAGPLLGTALRPSGVGYILVWYEDD